MKKSIIELITDKDDNEAYKNAKLIAAESEKSKKYYKYVDEFVELLNNSNSYIRTRAFILICCQAKWDKEEKINSSLSKMFKLFNDEKPTVVRQCLNAIKEVVIYKPELSSKVLKAIKRIDLSNYKESMSSLIKKDINELISIISEQKTH